MIWGAAASAVIIRHDAPDAQYRIAEQEFPPLVQLPDEGQGVLIAPRWVVTVAHAVSWRRKPIASVTINGRARAVRRIVVHPGFQKPTGEFRGDAAPLMAWLSAQRDIALIELAEPVADVAPALFYTGRSARGKIAAIIGRGATGDGVTGQSLNAPHRSALRRAFNRIDSDQGLWLSYVFDAPPRALPLEGMLGTGDSGGPVLIRQRGVWRLAGLSSWKWHHGDIDEFRSGLYGQRSFQVRIAHYRDWIDQVIGGAAH